MERLWRDVGRELTTAPKLPAAGVNNVWYYRGRGDSAVVFVHGIFSDSRTCWLRQEPPPQYWPALIRSDQRFGDAGIYLGGFYTEVDAGDYDLADCAQELLSALKRPAADGTPSVLSSYRRLFFVCHSTGGIVVRYMLERWASDFDLHPVGVALIASPSLGSAWADLAKKLAAFYGQRLGLQLRQGNDNLADLDERFRDLVRRRTVAMLEGGEAHENRFILHRRWLPRIPRVVDPKSAGRGYWGAPVHLAGTDHFTAVKPRTMSDRSHTFVVDTWLSFLRATGGSAGLGAWVPTEAPIELEAISRATAQRGPRARGVLSSIGKSTRLASAAAALAIGLGVVFAVIRWDGPAEADLEGQDSSFTSAPSAPEITGGGRPLPPEQSQLLEEKRLEEPEQFRDETNFWPVGSVINLAFLSGSSMMRDEVKGAISNWTRNTSLRFAFVEPEASEVRVTFNMDGASWSYLGTQALVVPRTEPTTVLAIESFAADAREMTIHHEVGHMLGLIHEHQIPSADIFVWDVVEAAAGGPPNYWSREQLEMNLRPLEVDRVASVYRTKAFDPTSVMLFTFPDEWLKSSIRPQERPSAGDLALVRAIYP